jgi:hypothetical protein
MEFHCNSIVMADDDPTVQFSITLPLEAVEMIESGLIPFGIYGKKRATISAALILDALKSPAVQANIREGRSKARRAANRARPQSPTN